MLASNNITSTSRGNSDDVQPCNSFDHLESQLPTSQSESQSHLKEAEMEDGDGEADDNDNDNECNKEEEEAYIKSMMKERIKRSFRVVNIVILSTCIIAGLLRPMEEKQRRRSEPRSFSALALPTANTNTAASYSSDSSWAHLGLHFGRHFGSKQDTDTLPLSQDEIRAESHNRSGRRYLDEDENQDDQDQYNQDDEDENQEDDNDDQDNANDDVEEEAVVDDAYYNATNETYYQEDDQEYYEAIDDFYEYSGDDGVEYIKVFPMELTDYLGFICASLSIILSVGGGIGPGAILVAIYIVVMDFPPKVAIPLSCVTGLGVNTLGNIMNRKKRHPLGNRPIIDWDLVLVMEPVILLGAIIGTYLNKILEGKIIIVMLVLLLSVIAHNTLKKALKMHHAEELYIKRVMWAKQKRMNTQIMANSPVYPPGSFDNKLAEADPPFLPKIHNLNTPPGSPSNSVGSPNLPDSPISSPGASPQRKKKKKKRRDGRKRPLLDESGNSNGGGFGNADSNSDSSFSEKFSQYIVLRKEDHQSVKSSLIEEEADPLPQNKITYIVTMFLFVISTNVLKGGVAFESPLGVQCGSISFWLFELITAGWLVFCTTLAGRYLLRRNAIKEAVGYDYVRGDIKWDVRTVVIYPGACLFAGIISGMFGIGCAVFVGPLLVGIGVNPAVASATCGCMNFFTSLAATSSYVVLGSIIPDREYAMVLYVIGFVSSFIGIHVIHRAKSSTKIDYNKRLERHSYMAYSMGVVVLVSALCMTIEALLDVINHSFDQDELDGVCVEERMYFS